MSSNTDIKKYELSIEETEGKKPKKFLTKKLKAEDFGKEFVHKVYLDFISDGVPKAVYGEIKVKVGDVIPVNKPPTVDTISTINVKPSEPVKILATIKDPEGDVVTVTWEQTGGTVDFQQGNEVNDFWISFTAPSEDADFSFRVTATDNKGAVAYGNITVKVRKDPIPEPKPLVKVGQTGDLHGEHQALTLLKTREQCDLILVTGDVTDTESDDDGYIDAVKSVGLNYGEDLLNAQGNHSSAEEGGQGAQQDLETAFPLLKENQWLQFLVKGNVAVIVNNTQIEGYSQTDSVAAKHIMQSLAKLKELRAAGTVDWCIFMQHKPMYNLRGGHDPEYNFRYNFHSALDEAGVNFFINGHVHNIQRTFPIIYGGEGTNVPPKINTKMIGDAHDMTIYQENGKDVPHGLICIVNGSATKSHSLSEDSNPWTPFARDDTNSYVVFEFNEKKCTVKFVDIDSGTVQHEFKVTKEGGGEPEPERPVLRVTAPSQIKPQEVGTIDASQSTADDVTMLSREGLPLTPIAHWVNTFAAPNQENLNLQFTVDGTKGTYTANRIVDVRVASEIPVTTDSFGMQMLFNVDPSLSRIPMGWGTDHANGQRFNVNHDIMNYIFQGYFKIGEGQDAINYKGDGPNHGDCKTIPQCIWYEMHLELSNGKFELQFEKPHPTNHPVSDSLLELVKSFGKINAGQWIGWACAYYWGSDGYRHMKGFVDRNPFANNDPNTKPLNNWELGLYAVERGQIITDIEHPRDLKEVMNFDDRLEAEIRMNNATNHDTDMKNAWVIPIVPPTS